MGALVLLGAAVRAGLLAGGDCGVGEEPATQTGARIALRSAQFGEGGHISAHAGAGIVVGSDPEAELLETRMKFRPIVDALA